MKKTLIITLEYPPIIGGIGTYTHQFAAAMPSDKVVVLAPKHEQSAEFDAMQPFTTIRKELFFKNIWPAWFKLYVLVRKIVKEHHIEQIHVHHMLPVGYITKMLRKNFVPYLFAWH